MPKIREVEGLGRVRFPDSMSDADIDAAIQRHYPRRDTTTYPEGQYTIAPTMPISGQAGMIPRLTPPETTVQFMPEGFGQPIQGFGSFGGYTPEMGDMALGAMPPVPVGSMDFMTGEYTPESDPFEKFGHALTTAGKLAWAYGTESMEFPPKAMTFGIMPSPQDLKEMLLERRLPGYQRPPGNIEQVVKNRIMGRPDLLPEPYREQMPAESQMRIMPPHQQYFVKGAQGVVEAAPRMGLMAAMTGGAGVPMWLAGGLSFGLTDEGLDPHAATIGAVLPYGGPLAKGLGGWLEKSGIGTEASRNVVRGLIGYGAAPAGLLADQLITIDQMERDGTITPEEAKKERATAFYNLGFNLTTVGGGVVMERGKPQPLSMAERTSQNMLTHMPGQEALSAAEKSHLDAARDSVKARIRVVDNKKPAQPEPENLELTSEKAREEAPKKKKTKTYTLDPNKKYESYSVGDERRALDDTEPTPPIIPREGDPFARTKTGYEPGAGGIGVFMRANKNTGEIEVFPRELEMWLRTVPAKRRTRALRRRLNEEELHLATDPSAAMEFYLSLLPVTRAILGRTYTGNWMARDPNTKQLLKHQELAFEAVRIKLQQLEREGPGEVAEAALRERWTLRSILAMDDVIQGLWNKTIGADKAEGQQAILTKVKQNLDAAKRAVETGEMPAARRKQADPDRLPYDGLTQRYLSSITQLQDDPEAIKASQDEMWSDKAVTSGIPNVGQDQLPAARRKGAINNPDEIGRKGAFWMSPDTKMNKAEGGHDMFANGKLMREGSADDNFNYKANPYGYLFDKGWVRVAVDYISRDESAIFFEGKPTAKQMSELKNLAIEKGYKLVRDRSFGGWDVVFDPKGDSPAARMKFNPDVKDERDITKQLSAGFMKLFQPETARDENAVKELLGDMQDFIKHMRMKMLSGTLPEEQLRSIDQKLNQAQRAIDFYPRDRGESSDQIGFPAARRKREQTAQSFFDAANMLAGRTRYGYHTQPATKDSFIVSWSNGQGRWNVNPKDQIGFHGSISETMRPWLQDSDITSLPEGHVWLDANQILVNAKTRKEAQLIADNLPRHPLDEFSFENNPMFKEGSSIDDVVGFYENLSQVAMDFRGAKSPNVIDATSKFLDKLEPDSPAARRKKSQQEADQAGFLGLTGKVPYARQDPEAAALYGDVRPQQGEAPYGQMPTEEGGAGIQPPSSLMPAGLRKNAAPDYTPETQNGVLSGMLKWYMHLKEISDGLRNGESTPDEMRAALSQMNSWVDSAGKVISGIEKNEVGEAESSHYSEVAKFVDTQRNDMNKWFGEGDQQSFYAARRKDILKGSEAEVATVEKKLISMGVSPSAAREQAEAIVMSMIRSENVMDSMRDQLGYNDDMQSFAAGRRKGKRDLQTGLDFETKQPAAEDPTSPKWAPITPQILEDSVTQHILENPDPSFGAFAKMANDKWGVHPGQLHNVWRGKVWDTLMKATGRQLTDLVFKLDLGSKLKIKRRLARMKEKIAAGATKPGEMGPSLTSAENLVVANKMYGQIPDAESAPNPVVKQFLMEFEGQPSEMMTGLRNALKRAATAKKREAEYLRWFDEAKQLREQLRGLGFTNIDEKGNPIGGATAPSIAGRGIGKRLLNARIQMDMLADPDYFARPQDRETFIKTREREVKYHADEVKGEKVIHFDKPTSVTVYNRLIRTGKVKVPEYESMARPGFSPGLPTRKGSAQTRAGQARRIRVIAELGGRLLGIPDESPTQSVNRRTVTADDVAYHRGPDAVRQLTPEEQSNPAVVASIIAQAPAPDRATRVGKVVGGEEVSGSRQRASEKDTNNLVALEDTVTGTVHLVSVYKHVYGKGQDPEVLINNPHRTRTTRTHEPLSGDFLKRFRPLWSIQIDQPVRDFAQRFKDRDAFRREFIADTRGKFTEVAESQAVAEMMTQDAVARAQRKLDIERSVGVINEEQFTEMSADLQQKAKELGSNVRQKPGVFSEGNLFKRALGNPQIAPSEAAAIFSKLKLWKHENPQDVMAELDQMIKKGAERTEFTSQSEQEARSGYRLAAAGLQKLMNDLESFGFPYDRESIVRNLLNLSENRADFMRTMTGIGEVQGPPHEIGSTRRPIGTESASDPRELTMRSPGELARANVIRRQAGMREVGPQRDPAVHTPETYRRPETEMMTPEESEYVRSQKMTYGGDTPAAINKNRVVKAAVDSVRHSWIDPTGGFLRYYSGWMGDRLREGGGTMGMQFADVVDRIIDRQKQVYGNMTRVVTPALKEAGKRNAATSWLNNFREVGGFGKDAAIGNLIGSVEGWIHVPKFARKLVGMVQVVNLAAGRIVEPVTPGFTASGSVERHLTPLGYDIIRAGRGPMWHAWIDGLAEANRVDKSNTKASMKEFFDRRQQAQEIFIRWKEALDDPAPDTAKLDRINQDFVRKFPRAVSHVRSRHLGIFGGWKPVLHANAFDYINATSKRASHARAFREQFPATPLGTASYDRFRKGIASEDTPRIPTHERNTAALMDNFDSLTRALQGHPTDQYGNWRNRPTEILTPGKMIPDATRFLNQTVGNFMAKLVLSKQMITQLPELVAGSAPRYLGTRNYARAAMMVLKDMATKRTLYEQMEQAGMVNRVVYDWSLEPGIGILGRRLPSLTSLGRVAGNVVSKAFMEQALNEAQERMAAATAKVVTERIVKGDLSNWEKRNLPNTFKAMGFQSGEINAMMLGDPGVAEMFQRRAAAFLTGGNKHVAEGSRLGANRFFNSIFRFQSYPMMKANQLRKDIINFVDAPTGAARGVATEQLARNLFFNTLQGAMTAGLAAGINAAFGQTMGAQVKYNEAKDRPMRFLLESYFASQSGPMYMLWRNMSDGSILGAGDQVMNMMFPYAMFREMTDMASGMGAYRDQTVDDRIMTFMRRKVPGLEPIRTGMAAVGLSKYNADYKAALDGYYRWKKSIGESGGTPGESSEPLSKEFRLQMKRAQAAIIAGDRDKYVEAILTASAVKTPEQAADSLMGRRLGIESMPIDKQSALMDRIGVDAYKLLEAYDNMFEATAKEINPPKKKR